MGLGNVAMAFVSAEAGRTGMGPYILNAQAPDEGNMHTLLHNATPTRRRRSTCARWPRAARGHASR